MEKESRIFKYTFDVNDLIEIEMPLNAIILSVQTQRGIPCIWAIVNPNAPLERRELVCIGTGHPINIDIYKYKYIGTFQLFDGDMICHLFENTN